MRRWIIPILVVFAWPSYTRCQQTDQSNKVSYEGQEVVVVDLIANPNISVESLQPLVQQRAGEPYSGSKVDGTIAALRATGRFSNVEVDVKPDRGGLRLAFVLEPALYFGIFEFPGASKSFSYTKLLQVVDIPNQTPYQKQLVSKAGEQLHHFLVSAGYFQAHVQPEPSFDETHLLANVVFHINLGKRAKVGKMEIQGAERGEADHLLRATRSLRATVTGGSLKAGKAYTPKRIDSAIALMKRDLANQNHLSSKVHFDRSNYDKNTNHADLVIDVRPGPIVKVRVTGAKLSWVPFLRGRQMKKLIPIFSEGAIDPDLVEEGRRNLIDFFQSKGYFDAKVASNMQNEASRIELLYDVDRGSRHKVETVAFRGNQHVGNKELIQQVAVKAHRFLSRGHFSEKLLRQSVSSITTFYKNLGYEEVKVDSDVVDREPQVFVTFQINEGPQTLVDHITIEGNSHIATSELASKARFRLGPGQPFSAKSLAEDRTHIMALYLERGFLNSEFDSTVTRLPNDPHRVDVTYKIMEKQQVRVDKLVLLGNKKTRPSLIKKTANIAQEAPLSERALLNGESRLQDLGVFDWTSVEQRRPIIDQETEDVVVKLHEAGTNEVAYGFGLQVARRGGNLPSGTIALPGLPPVTSGAPNFTAAEKTFVSPRGSVTFTRYNVRGLAESASASILVSRLDQRALATYTQPHFRGSSWSSLFSVSIERTTENPTFAARLAEGSWQLEKPLNKDKTRGIQVRYRFRRTILSDLLIPGLVLPQDQRLRLSTLSATWIRDTRDKPLDASRGFYQTLDLGITTKALGSNANFARFLGQSSYYKPFGQTIWANRITLGLAKAYGNSDVPTSEKFFSGGETTLRGFPINGAGPQRTVPACTNPANPSTCVNLQVPVGGRQLFILNSEWRFPLGIKRGLGAAVFYDGGNVYGPIGISRFIEDYTNTVGVGLRYNTPVGPIRFDIGRNLNPVTGVKATQFYITLGQAF
jgi:outer membrane protein insertion porin family